jgi:hypothetical protein
MLIVIESSKYDAISSSINTYVSDIASGDSSAKSIRWTGNSASQLRDTIEWYYNKYNIKGAFLIGDLPYAQYEMDDWGEHEEFPTDIYYCSPGTQWYDSDSDGIYDSHSSYNVRYFAGRINGTSSEINDYFSKAHKYRTQGTSVLKRAFLFIDNDWSEMYKNEQFDIDYLYSNIYSSWDTTLTTKAAYTTELTTGAEYVFQLIHASFNTLYFVHQGAYQTMSLSELNSNNPKGCFYNLFNCSGCKYSEDNLGMHYVMNTTKGLAVMGSTKTGGNYYPQSFNQSLSQNKSWGESFVIWWNSGGNYLDDKWKLGLVIFGDPMLKIPSSVPVKKIAGKNVPPSISLTQKLEEIIIKERNINFN